MASVIKAGVTDAAGVRVRPLAAEDLDEADRICRDRAWRVLASRGFRPDVQGMTMHRPNEPG